MKDEEAERTKTNKELLMDIYKHSNAMVKLNHKMMNKEIRNTNFERVILYKHELDTSKTFRDYVRATIGNEMQNWDELNEIWNPYVYEDLGMQWFSDLPDKK